jgi:hypothetical protein
MECWKAPKSELPNRPAILALVVDQFERIFLFVFWNKNHSPDRPSAFRRILFLVNRRVFQ